MEKQLKEIIRSVLREEFISELSKNDVHVKEIIPSLTTERIISFICFSIYILNNLDINIKIYELDCFLIKFSANFFTNSGPLENALS